MDNPITYFDVSVSLTPCEAAHLELPRHVPIETIRQFQMVLEDSGLPEPHCPVEHFFAPGMYGRKCSIPAGSYVVGKQHRHEHLVMLTKGETTISMDGEMRRIKAPHVWVSKAGEKRVLYTHEDCEFVTTHATEETDLKALEAELIVPEPKPALEAGDSFHSRALQGVYA